MTQTVSESGDDDDPTTGLTATTGESDTESDGESETDTDTDTDTDTGTSSDSGDPEPVCGDGMVDEGEDCDDAGESAQCNDDCTFALCGDGLVNMTAAEQCDDMGESATCDADCTDAVCGDGVVNASASEDCDGIDLAGTTCMDLGFTGGMLACDGGCAFDPSGCSNQAPAAPTLALGFSAVKRFDFTWAAVPDADHYQLELSPSFGEPFVPVAVNIVGESLSLTVPLHFRHESSYRLLACNQAGCTNSAPVGVIGTLAEATGYFKASNTESVDQFGLDMALSEDGSTLVVSAPLEDSSAIGINGNEANNFAFDSGAVYVFVLDAMGQWSQQAYIKASNPDDNDEFGGSIALSADGNTLAVGAMGEDSDTTGINGDPLSNAASNSGAAYVFVRDGMGLWSQQAYVKASNTTLNDEFGGSVALSADGDTLAVGATGEDSNATGIDGDQLNGFAFGSGAVYVFGRDGMGLWSQQAYVKASNTGNSDAFGGSVTFGGNGDLLAVGAAFEDSSATGIDGFNNNNSTNSGAVYVFERDGMGLWSQQAYVKASNTANSDAFGISVALSANASTLAVGATGEDSNATGIDGNTANNFASDSGAVYVFERDGMGQWSQQAYVKASNTNQVDWFGTDVALSGGGNTLAVGAISEDSNAVGINGSQLNNGSFGSGATYVFVRDGMGQWSQQAYVKTSNLANNDEFGSAVALSADGQTLAASALGEDSNATGIDGDQLDNFAGNSGAVYLY